MSWKAIDVSKHQGTIDWKKVAADGVKAVFIRAGYGKYDTQKDSQFDANVKGAYAAGIPIGIYWYSYATTVAEAREEASACIRIIKPHKAKIMLPVFFDQEYEKGIVAASTAVRTAMCKAFMEEIAKAGYESGIYCSYDWIRNKIGKVDGKKWIAQYSAQCGYTGSDLYMWQYTSKGSVAGIKGNVDMDRLYTDPQPKAEPKWEKTDKGWKYGEYKTRWLKKDGAWYWFDGSGIAVTGWHSVNGTYYYFADSAFARASDGRVKECQCLEITKD